MKTIVEERRLKAPTITPQALTWNGSALWLSSRDLGTLQKIDVQRWIATEELDPPGIVWAAVATNGAMHLTIGKGLNDDRYVYRYDSRNGFKKLFAMRTGSRRSTRARQGPPRLPRRSRVPYLPPLHALAVSTVASNESVLSCNHRQDIRRLDARHSGSRSRARIRRGGASGKPSQGR